MTKLTISLAQMRIKLARVDDNLATSTNMVAQAAADGADIALLPELWSTGYDLENAREHAAKLGEAVFAQVAEAAPQKPHRHLWLAAGAPRRAGHELRDAL